MPWFKSLRLCTKYMLSAVLLLSVVTFMLFALYTHSGDNVISEETKLGDIQETKRSGPEDLSQGLEKNIKNVEEKIKMAEQTRSALVFKHLRKNQSVLESDQKEEYESSMVAKGNKAAEDESLTTALNYDVHLFYYPWYKNEKTDGKYAHWNHELIPHWSEKSHTRRRHHTPPGDIGANFYPLLGPYSSADPETVDAHMKQIRGPGAGVLAVSWYPPKYEQTNETPVDSLMKMLLDAAARYGLKIAFHIEPYKDRSGETLLEVLKYVIDTYGNHSAFYRTEHKGKQLPLFYVYDSYQIKPHLWADALKEEGRLSIRGSKYDAVLLGLLVEREHFNHLSDSGFDGFYTYFASNGFSYGSSWKNWPLIAAEAKKRNLIFVPSIGPGYIDTRVRQWNGRNTKLRLNGRYYKSAFHSALAVRPRLLSITSFNEWHEGTQIEPAVPMLFEGFKYEDYSPNGPQFYMNLTKHFVDEYRRNMTQLVQSHEHADTF